MEHLHARLVDIELICLVAAYLKATPSVVAAALDWTPGTRRRLSTQEIIALKLSQQVTLYASWVFEIENTLAN